MLIKFYFVIYGFCNNEANIFPKLNTFYYYYFRIYFQNLTVLQTGYIQKINKKNTKKKPL